MEESLRDAHEEGLDELITISTSTNTTLVPTKTRDDELIMPVSYAQERRSTEAVAVDVQLRRSGRERKSVVPFYPKAATEMKLDEDDKEGWQTSGHNLLVAEDMGKQQLMSSRRSFFLIKTLH